MSKQNCNRIFQVRLSDEDSSKIDDIFEVTGMSRADIFRESLNIYHKLIIYSKELGIERDI